MASTTVSVICPTLLGAAVDACVAIGSGMTCTLTVSTAQGTIDGSSFMIRAYNAMSAETATLTIGVGTEGSSFGLGGSLITAVPSASSVIIGGQGFDTSRFMTSGDTIVVTATTGDAWQIEAYQMPRASQ